MEDNDFNIDDFVSLSVSERKQYILEQSELITIPSSINSDLFESYKYKEVINKFVIDYVKKKNKLDESEKKENIKRILQNFKNNFINHNLPLKLSEKYTNLFEMSEAKVFAKVQGVTRSITTIMGSLWEDIAQLSDVVISTDTEFDLKIKGVDIVIIENDLPTYTQLKTMEGTLTGSQSKRSIDELSLHENSLFAACFKTDTNWTFPECNIARVVGDEFWKRIDLDYKVILENVSEVIKEIEDKYVELAN
jgi:hypothetical protein